MHDLGLFDRDRVLSLLDSYETLLTDKQRAAVDAYYRYDLSLSEIAEQEGISRSGVSDALKKTIAKLEEFETSLGLVAKKKMWIDEEKRIAESPSDSQTENYRRLVEEIIHGI